MKWKLDSLHCSDCSKHPTFAYLVNESRVAIIGRSSTLKRSNSGQFLDENFDLIVRVNHLPTPEEARDLGSSADILAHNFALLDSDREFGEYERLGLLNECKTIVFPRLALDRQARHLQSQEPNLDWESQLSEIAPSLQVESFDQEYLQGLYDLLGGYPTTGGLMIAICAGHNPSSTYITGFDWYSSLNPHFSKTNLWSWLRNAKTAGHPLKSEVKALQKMYQLNESLEGDAIFDKLIAQGLYRGPNTLLTLKTFIQNGIESIGQRLRGNKFD